MSLQKQTGAVPGRTSSPKGCGQQIVFIHQTKFTSDIHGLASRLP
jgi:hypothetical protein